MDLSFFKKSYPTVIRLGLMFVVMVIVGYFLLKPKDTLPIYNPADVNPRLVDPAIKHIRANHKVANFELINQNGQKVTQEDYKDKIYIADFFFTRCQTICPIMTNNMSALQQIFLEDDDIKFLSHSVTPEMDSIPVLRAYADAKGVLDAKWNLVTGSKKEIYRLARTSYFAVLDEGDGGSQDFIHTEQFVLIDKNRQIRGFYDGTDKTVLPQIVKDISILKRED